MNSLIGSWWCTIVCNSCRFIIMPPSQFRHITSPRSVAKDTPTAAGRGHEALAVLEAQGLVAAQQGRAHVGDDDLVRLEEAVQALDEAVGVHEALLVGVLLADPRELGLVGAALLDPGGFRHRRRRQRF